MKSYVIAIEGLHRSELGARNCIRSGEKFGVAIHPFKAITKFESVESMTNEGLFLNKNFYQGISDGVLRDYEKPGDWWLTTPEIGCLMSHYFLWKLSVKSREPLAIFEHDAILVSPLPSLPNDALAIVLYIPVDHFYTTIGYIVTPHAAQIAINEVQKNGVQPADEILWKAALGGQSVLVCRDSIVACEDHGISTIQYAHHGKKQHELGESDPWLDYSPSKKLVI